MNFLPLSRTTLSNPYNEMIVIMAGLPATGKSTLARAVASELNGIVVDKDSVRAALFSSCVDYTPEQDDLSMECVYSAVRYMAHAHGDVPVFIDGRPFARKVHLERALEVIQETGALWRIIETTCSDEVARARLEAAASHLAANRTFDLYCALKARLEPISDPKLIVNTERPIEHCVQQCVDYLASVRAAPDGTPHRQSDRA